MAAGTASVDTMLADAIAKMDALHKRMDALEVGEKSVIKGDKKRSDDDDDDDDRKDSTKKSDATVPKKHIMDSKKSDDDDDDKKSDDDDDDDDDRKDSAKKADDDDDDDDRKDSAKAKSDDDDDDDRKDTAAKKDAFPPKKDAAKKDAFPPKKAKDDDGELEIKHGKDDSRKKSDSKKRGDDDDDDRRDDKRADAVADLRQQIADQRATIRRLESLMKPRTDDEHTAFADAQAKADSVFIGFGQRAPRPMEGEELDDYRKRLAGKLKGYSTAWKNVKLTKLPNEAFDIAETQIYADATTAANNPTDIAAGELRMVSRQDPDTGLRTNYFYGPESFVKKMGRPGRRVQSFRTNPSV